MRIGVIGSGYVGLVVGACLANTGNHVVCADVDEAKIEGLRRGEIPIYEPGLDELVERNLGADRLSFTTDVPEAIEHAEVIFIAVGTPQDEDGSADLQHVLDVAATIGDHQDAYKIVVCKSTVPVGTCDRVREVLAERSEHDFDVISNPEFLKEGSAVQDFQSPDRVVIGGESRVACETVAELYRPLMRRSERIMIMDTRSAEMTKYASNAMLATKISFINEIARLCDAVDANVEMVRRGMSKDRRIGPHFIYPGVGFGGSCFPKDIRALEHLGVEAGSDMAILKAVRHVNSRQKVWLVDKALEHFEGSLEGRRFAVWGLSFKPRTDDTREAPALESIRRLVEAGATVVATDPAAAANARRELADLGDAVEIVENDDYAPLADADGLFVFTEWEQYRSPDFQRMAELLDEPVLFDGRNLYRRQFLENHGFTYYCVGRPRVETGE